jgi:hypothetical protein
MGPLIDPPPPVNRKKKTLILLLRKPEQEKGRDYKPGEQRVHVFPET